jgi:hypothetical protein
MSKRRLFHLIWFEPLETQPHMPTTYSEESEPEWEKEIHIYIYIYMTLEA